MTIYLTRARNMILKKSCRVILSNSMVNNKHLSPHPLPSADTVRNHNVGTLPVVPRLSSAMTVGLILTSYWEYTGVTPQLYKKVAGGEKGEIAKFIYLQAIIHLLIIV